MKQAGQSWGRICARVVSLIVVPIAIPAWTIEWIVSRFKPGWHFGPFIATPYFLALAVFSTLTSLYLGAVWVALALYVLTAMQILAVWLCLSIALGRPTEIYAWLREFGRRRQATSKDGVLLTPASLYVGMVSYGFTIYYFAFVDFIIHTFSRNSFAGVKDASPIETLWTFTYHSAVTITTLGYGDIVPKTPIAQAATVVELFAGFFFVVFLFGAFVSYQVGKLR